MKTLTREELKQILGGTQNLSSDNSDTPTMQLAPVGGDITVVNFTGNDLEE